MDVRQLDMFRSVAEEGGFTRAAERLHVSQSAVSRQVKLLEEELGSLLLHRHGRRVVLTASGELLLKLANRVQRDIQDAVWQIGETGKLHRGQLHVGGGMTVCLFILPRLLKRFRRLYREVDLRVTSGTSEAILRLLRNHDVDLGLLTLPIVASDMVVVTAPGHPLSRSRAADPKQLARFPWILFEAGSNSRKVIDQFFLEEGVP